MIYNLKTLTGSASKERGWQEIISFDTSITYMLVIYAHRAHSSVCDRISHSPALSSPIEARIVMPAAGQVKGAECREVRISQSGSLHVLLPNRS